MSKHGLLDNKNVPDANAPSGSDNLGMVFNESGLLDGIVTPTMLGFIEKAAHLVASRHASPAAAAEAFVAALPATPQVEQAIAMLVSHYAARDIPSGAPPAPIAQILSAAASLMAPTSTTHAAAAPALTPQQTTIMTSSIALGANVATALYGVTGAGLKIGIISDSYNARGGAATDQANGLLPANVTILADQASGSDEGRAMLALAYSIAPGATYYTAEGNSFAENVAALQAAGVNIIIDDLTVGGEGLYQLGSAADVAIENAVAAGVNYFTSAGNNGNSYYEQGFTPLATTIANIGSVTANDFGGNSPYLSLTITNGSTINPIFQFAQPFVDDGAGVNSPTNSLAIYLLDADGNIVASSTIDDVGGNPTQSFSFKNTTSNTAFRLVVVQNGGIVPAGQLFKFVLEDGGATINSPTAGMGSGDLVGHELLNNINVLGSVSYFNTPAYGASATIDSGSSVGPGTILFDTQGNPIATVTQGVPQFESVDGTLTGSANSNFATSPFFGTSAAAPTAGAVAALVLQANRALTTAQVTSVLAQSVIPVATTVPSSGAGLIQARAAVEIAAADAGDRWTTAAGGNWNSASSWSGGAAPTNAQAASLDDNIGGFTGQYIVTVDTLGDVAGSLAIAAPAGSSSTLVIATGGALAIGGSAASNITAGDLLVSDNGTLNVTGGTLSVSGSLNVNNGTVVVSLGNVTASNYAQNSGSLTIGGGASPVNLMLPVIAETGGTITVLAMSTLTVTTFTVSAALLTIAGKVTDTGDLSAGASTGTGSAVLQAGGELDVGGSNIGVGITFAGNGLLEYTTSVSTILVSGVSGLITGLAANNGAIDFTGLTYDAGYSVQYFSDNGQAAIVDQGGTFLANIYLNKSVDYTGKLALQADSANHVEIVVPCYCPGTLISTAAGEILVEDLSIGDVVVTASGRHEPIRWIGRRSYAGAFIAGQHLMLPVCFKRGSIADGVPHTDLWVSPGHGMFVDGQLIPAWRLVNGASVVQAETVESVTYIHIELGGHDILVANGAQAESFLDETGFRGQFHNAAEFAALYPEPRAVVPLQARLENGFALHRIQERLATRAGLFPSVEPAGALLGFVDQAGPNRVCGWAQDADSPEEPVELEVLVDGKLVACVLANGWRADLRKAGMGSGCHAFDMALSEGTAGVVSVRRATDGRALALTSAAAELDQRLAA